MDRASATKKTFLEDAYTVSFKAKLLSCSELSDGRLAAVLDQTYFYPESGGQLSDRGTLDGVEVLDVWEDDSETVYHCVASPLSPGPVEGQCDWDLRFDHMQQHTGQHVLSRAFIETGNLETVSFHMGDESCTIDLAGGDLTADVLQSAESLANEVICEDREVRIRNVSPSDLSEAALRKKLPDGVEKVRLVEIDGFDVIGCCGTHVRRTGELGVIKVLKHEKAKGAFRVSFKVGRRAFLDYGDKHEIVQNLARRFTTSAGSLEDKIEKIQIEGQQQRKELQKISRRLAAYEAEDLLKTAVEHEARKFVVRVLSGHDETYLKALATELKARANTISMLGTDFGLVICNASADVDVDFTGPVIERARSLGGSGGGKGGFATVQLPGEVDLGVFLEQAFEQIRSS